MLIKKQFTIWKLGYINLALFFTAFLLLLAIDFNGILELFHRWNTQEEYSHGYMIVLIVIYFIWQKRPEIQSIIFYPAWLGIFLIVIALLFTIIGEISALYILIQYSFVFILLGIIWMVMGQEAFKILMPPTIILLFAIPLPYFLEATLTANLQLLSSKLGVHFVRWCHIPVFSEGNILDFGKFKLEVIEACSGLRYLYPLMGIGYIFVYLYNASFWRRALIFFSTIPISLLMNSFRVAMVGILVNYWGADLAKGFLHDFEGWVVFIGCLGVLILEMLLIEAIVPGRKPITLFFNNSTAISTNNSLPVKTRLVLKPLIYIIFILLVSGGIILSIDKRSDIKPPRLNFSEFPMQISDWQGNHADMDSDTVNALGFSDFLFTNFSIPNKPSINLYAAYYASQRKGVSPHSPQVCLPGGGWQITDIQRKSYGNMNVNRVIIKKDNITQMVFYWFQERGKAFSNEYIMKFNLLKDAVLVNRTDGALVRLATIVVPDESLENAEQRLADFSKLIQPELPKFIPD